MTTPDITEIPASEAPPAPSSNRVRTGLGWLLTGLAFALVWFALLAPNRLERLTPGAFLRIPIEGLVAVGGCIFLPVKPRRIFAAVVGAVLGVLTIVKILDIGFFQELTGATSVRLRACCATLSAPVVPPASRSSPWSSC
jgi:hypothetical protein